jgi:hypothetical protein
MKKIVYIVFIISYSLILPVSALTFDSNLSFGARGENVKKLQEFLITNTFLSGEVTSYFGAQTKIAVQKFQKESNVPATGNWFAMTRQKAESYKKNTTAATSTSVIISTSSPISVATSTNIISESVVKKDELTLSVGSGGKVFSNEDKIACYSLENCSYVFTEGKTISLRAIANPGYIFKGWSEASCGNQPFCTFKITQPMKVYAYFEIFKLDSAKGEIISPNYPNETCYVKLGRDDCDFRFTYRADVDVNVKINEDEYIIEPKTNNLYYQWDVQKEDLEKAASENASGLTYFKLWPHNKYTVQLLSRDGKVLLDKMTVDVKCAPGLTWDGAKCWEKGVNTLYIFKRNSVVFTTDPEGIFCGGEPEVCAAGFSSGQKVTIHASTTSFNGWTGDCQGMLPTCTVIMDKTRSVGVKW